MDDLFDAFEPVSKADWLANVANDPRSAPLLEKLDWELGDVSMPAYASAVDLPEKASTEVTWVLPHSWRIVTWMPTGAQASDYDDALAAGTEGFWFDEAPHQMPKASSYLYNDAFVGVKGLTLLDSIDAQAKKDLSLISLCKTPAPSQDFFQANIKRLVDHAPCRTITLPVAGLHKHPAQRLATVLTSVQLALQTGKEAGINPAAMLQTMALVFEPTTSFYLELAAMRAMRLLISKLVVDEVAEVNLPFVAFIKADGSNQLIAQTTMAMAAVLGGCSTLCIHPGDEHPAHLARNTQHILKLESHLGQVIDPAAGSYYIASLTQKLASAAWEHYIVNTQAGHDHA